MDWVTTLVTAAVAVIVVFVIYRMSGERALSREKPGFCWLPKYRFLVALVQEIAGAEDPLSALSNRMGGYGFTLITSDDDRAEFARGSVLGDFSIKIAKVDISFVLPLGSETETTAKYGALALFDTGDLWTFCQELKADLENAKGGG